MLDIITFINNFGYTVINNIITITTDIQKNKENFLKAFQALQEAYSQKGGKCAVKEYLDIWGIKTGYSNGYLVDDIIVFMCYDTDNFITDLNA